MASAYAEFWKTAEDEEMESLYGHGTWQEVSRSSVPKGHPVFSCRWVYVAKADAEGHVARFKARLVIHGFRQRYGVDYYETYSPVVRYDSIRAILYYDVRRRWSVLQYDVKTAFLHGDLDELVFMELPPGREGDRTTVCRLAKSLYGLKQAPRVWNMMLHRALVATGLKRLNSDHGRYARQVGDDLDALVSVYVDDLLILCEPATCKEISDALRAQFQLTDLGPVRFLLGIEVHIDVEEGAIFLSQATYIFTILKRFHMLECNGVATPESKIESTTKPPKDQDMPYREIVGAIQYLVSGTRPDIAHATRFLGQFNSCFDWSHFQKTKRVLRYLKATQDHGLLIKVSRDVLARVEVFTDADYANDESDRKSVSGYVSQTDGDSIAYASKKQEVTAISTSEAE
jgi:hypothetical protein